MDATTVDKRIAALLAGDNLLQTRLAEMEAKFEAWLAAMNAGQNLLRDALRRLRTPQTLPAQAAVAQPPPEMAACDTPANPATSGAEDERLLQTLDPETANAIRVKRRLCGDKRSVRELLEEVQAARPGQTSPRKRWWRRGDE